MMDNHVSFLSIPLPILIAFSQLNPKSEPHDFLLSYTDGHSYCRYCRLQQGGSVRLPVDEHTQLVQEWTDWLHAALNEVYLWITANPQLFQYEVTGVAQEEAGENAQGEGENEDSTWDSVYDELFEPYQELVAAYDALTSEDEDVEATENDDEGDDEGREREEEKHVDE